MKPKYNRFLRVAFPSLIILPAMAQMASAAAIMPDGAGNVLITTTGESGANNIVVPLGQPPAFSPFEIRLDPNAFLTPAGAASIDVQDTAATYTVNMGAGSSIDAGPNDGITSAAANLTVNSNGTISGANGISGVTPGIINVVNNSSITGTAGSGISTTGSLNLTNNFLQPSDIPMTVVGSVNGVSAGDASSILNSGSIIGQSGDGVIVGNGATVSNLTTFDTGPFGAIFGGQILGDINGVTAGNNLTLTNQNRGSITGTAGDGIAAGNDANITNASAANVTGGEKGISAGTGLTLNNSGTITGQNDDGVAATTGANITNSGTITANGVNGDGIYLEANGVVNNTGSIVSNFDDGIDSDGSAGQTFTLTNSGFISGSDKSVTGEDSDDTLNLNLGSRLMGDVYAYGGTDTINFGAGLSSPGGTGNSISGDVLEFDTINKAMGGVALIGLTGDPNFDVTVNTINITGGGLYINADINGNNVAQTTINAGGAALGGTGIWNANVNVTSGGISAGAIPINLDVNPANSIGQVTITGDVDHSPGSFIRFDVAPQGGGQDLIRQTGVGNTYDVTDANIRIAATDNNRVIRDDTYTVVDSAQVITGVNTGDLQVQFNSNVNSNDTFAQGSEIFNSNPVGTTILTNFFTTVGTQNSGTNLVLTVNHDFSNLPGLNSNESALGAALDESINTSSSITQDFIAALDYSNLGAVQNTLASIIPDNVLASASALTSGNYRVNRLVQDHLARTRSGGGVVETPAMTDAKGGMIPATTTMTGGGMGNVWGTFSYDWRDSDFGGTDIDGDSASFTAGVDYRVAPNFLLGFLLDGSQSDYDYSGGGSDIDSFRAAIYGTYGEATGIYADFLLGYGNHDLDLDRNLSGILTGTSYNTSTDADSLQALITVGYAMQSGDIKHGPFAGFEYQNLEVDSFSPSGVAGTIGGVSSFDVDSLRFLIGYRSETTYGQFSPYASITYAHEFEDDSIGTTATIPGGASFGFNGGGMDSAILISIGSGYAINQDLSLNFGYRGEFSTGDGVDSNGASVGLSYEF